MSLKLPVVQAERSCGECTACCTVLGVKEIKKHRGVTCPHLLQAPGGAGCGIYETRPQSCRDFKCWWLDGPLEPEEFRPDKIGIVVVRVYQDLAKRQMLTIYEVERGALLRPEFIRFIGLAVLNDEMIMTVHHDRIGVTGKDYRQAQWLLARIHERAKAAGIPVNKPYQILGGI